MAELLLVISTTACVHGSTNGTNIVQGSTNGTIGYTIGTYGTIGKDRLWAILQTIYSVGKITNA